MVLVRCAEATRGQERGGFGVGARVLPARREMDGRDQHQHQSQQQQQQAQAAARVGSPPQPGGGAVMMQHAAAFGAAAPPGMQPGPGNVMHGMPLAFNPMASPGASSPMKPADVPPGAMYRPDSGAPGMQQQQQQPQPHPGAGGGGGELVKKKRGRPRKYGPDGTIGLGQKPAAATGAEAGGHSGGGGSNSNPDGKRRGRPPGSGKKKQLDALGNIACTSSLCSAFCVSILISVPFLETVAWPVAVALENVVQKRGCMWPDFWNKFLCLFFLLYI